MTVQWVVEESPVEWTIDEEPAVSWSVYSPTGSIPAASLTGLAPVLAPIIGGVVGGQGQGPTLVSSATETDLLSAPITLPAFQVGDVLRIEAGYRFRQNTGFDRHVTFRIKLDGSTAFTLTADEIGPNADDRNGYLFGYLRVGSPSRGVLRCEHYVLAGEVGVQGVTLGSSSVDLTAGGVDLTITGDLDAASANYSVQLDSVAIYRMTNL